MGGDERGEGIEETFTDTGWTYKGNGGSSGLEGEGLSSPSPHRRGEVVGSGWPSRSADAVDVAHWVGAWVILVVEPLPVNATWSRSDAFLLQPFGQLKRLMGSPPSPRLFGAGGAGGPLPAVEEAGKTSRAALGRLRPSWVTFWGEGAGD